MASTLYTSTAEDKARFVKSDADMAVTQTEADAESRTLWREWPSIDASDAKDLAGTMMGTAQVTDPQADEETYTGLYSVADVVVIENNRRWVTIRQKLIRITTITSSTDLPQPVDSARRETYRPFQYDPGYGDIRIFEYKFLDRSSREVCMDEDNISDDDLEQSGYTLEGRRWITEERGDRTCTFVTFQRKVTWENINEAGNAVDNDHDMEIDGYYSGDKYLKLNYSKRNVAYGVPIDDAADVVTKWTDDEDPATSGYATEKISIIMQPNGEVFLSRVLDYANTDSTDYTNGFVIRRNMYMVNAVPKAIVVMVPKLTKTDADSLISNLGSRSTIVLDGTTYRNYGVSRNILPSGLANVLVEGRILGLTGRRSNMVLGEILGYKTFITVSDDGAQPYKVVFDRLVTANESAALTWANGSTNRPSLNNLRGHKGGRVDYVENYGVYVAFRETWSETNDFL